MNYTMFLNGACMKDDKNQPVEVSITTMEELYNIVRVYKNGNVHRKVIIDWNDNSINIID